MEYEAMIEWEPAPSLRALRDAIAEEPDSVVLDDVNVGRTLHMAEVYEGDEIRFNVASGARGTICRVHGKLVVR